MPWPAQAAALVGLALVALVAARFPRALFTEAGEAPHPRRAELALAAGLLIAGLLLFEAWPAGGPLPRFLTAAVTMVCAATVYSDLRFLVIPDLYSLAALAGALALTLLSPVPAGPHGLIEMALGAVICGGLLGSVAWVWKKSTDVEGLGLGDVKLAAALGALLGLQPGVWAITASAAGGALIGFILQARAKNRDAPLLFPYGAPLAMTGAGLLLWERWS